MEVSKFESVFRPSKEQRGHKLFICKNFFLKESNILLFVCAFRFWQDLIKGICLNLGLV